MIIGCELGTWQPFGPVVLEIVDMGSEILFHHGIGLLGLAIGLPVECGGKLDVNLPYLTQRLR